MSLFNKPLSEIVIGDIHELVSNSVGESRTLDYKLELHGNGDSGKKELLKDLSAFANTVGGNLIYGIEEEGGVPTQIIGVEVEDFDKLKLHYENLLRTGVAPAIRGVAFHSIFLDGNKYIIIIDVPKSISRPHAVTIKQHFKFYSRNSSGVHQLEVDDLRRAFLASETTANRIRNFRNDRLSKIATGEAPLQSLQGAKIVLHLIPVSSFDLGKKYAIDKEDHMDFPPLNSGMGGDYRMNFDGLLTYTVNNEGSANKYTQVFRNGIIEAVDSRMLHSGSDEHKLIPYSSFEPKLVDSLQQYLCSVEKHGIEFPIWICISLLDIKGYTMALGLRYLPDEIYPIDRDELIFPEIQIENNNKPSETILKPVFDLVWNACGFGSSFNYDEDGMWNPQKR